MQQALGITQAPAGPAAKPESAAVPSPRRKKASTAPGEKQKTRKSVAAPRKQAAGKRASKATGAAKAAQPTLVELIRRHLAEQKEPRSAAEISTALGQAHPDRDIAAKVVRITLEGLVAKSQAERSKQGRSVFYAAPASAPTAAPATEAQPADADH